MGYTQNTALLASERMLQMWNDLLLTDKYISGQSAIQLTDYDLYPNLYWYQTEGDNATQVRNNINEAIAREPLELMRHVF